MKSELDREMDALLRGHARRNNARGAAGAEEPVAHLDADELSAFAENTLPEAARARYASHLADCDDCRSIATQVALAANNIADLRASDVVRKLYLGLD